MMRKIIILVVMLALLLPVFGLAQDSKETMTLKRDLIQERVMRVQAELTLMKTQFREGQQALQTLTKELETLNASLKTAEETEKK
jgi:septal ring factor EnvC (AmiA/AmiB activator)